MSFIPPSGSGGYFGGRGNDTIYVGEGDDTVIGSDETDQTTGGSGNDLLDGGNGGTLPAAVLAMILWWASQKTTFLQAALARGYLTGVQDFGDQTCVFGNAYADCDVEFSI